MNHSQNDPDSPTEEVDPGASKINSAEACWNHFEEQESKVSDALLSLIHISEPTRRS